MTEQWSDDVELAPTDSSPFVDEGRTNGKGRGFKPYNINNNDSWPVGSRNGGYKGGNDINGYGNDNENGENGSSGGGWGSSNGGGDWGNGGGFGGSNRGNNGRGGGGRYDNRNGNGENEENGSSNGGGWGSSNGGDGWGNGGGFRGSNRDNNGRGGGGRYDNRNGNGENEENGSSNGGGGWGNGGGFRGSNRDNNGRGGGGRYDNRNGNGEDEENGSSNGGGWGSSNGGGWGSSNGGDGWGNGSGFGGSNRGNNGRAGGRRYDNGDDDDRQSRGNGGRGGGRGGGRDRSDGDFGESGGSCGWSGGKSRENGWGDKNGDEREDGQDPERPAPVTYIPPEISIDDEELFSGVGAGLNFAKYDEIKVVVSGENAPEPVENFQSMGLRKLVVDNIVKSGYAKPTPVQKNAIPIVMAGRDLMACAQTGSGKTAAFVVPIINTLLEAPTRLKLTERGCEPHCVIVSPTRELAMQIYRQALKFAKDSVIKCCAIYGGVATRHNGNQVANGCHILVATPGRLLHFLRDGRIGFGSVRFVVLDEADRMLDMGFLENMQTMMNHETMVPKDERQTLMFSATFGEAVQNVAQEFLRDYLFLKVGIVGGACADVEQFFEQVTKAEKRRKLMELIQREDIESFPRTMIFVETKMTADFLAGLLSDRKYPTTSMHGDRMQQQREEALRDFRSGRMPILVATAVAARGLDIKDVAHVINYDMPREIDEYVHRIGRTGRVGNRGKATSFFNFDTDSAIAADLVNILGVSGQIVPDWLAGGGGTGNFAGGPGDEFGGHDVRNFGNDDSCNDSANYPNTTCGAEPEEEW